MSFIRCHVSSVRQQVHYKHFGAQLIALFIICICILDMLYIYMYILDKGCHIFRNICCRMNNKITKWKTKIKYKNNDLHIMTSTGMALYGNMQ